MSFFTKFTISKSHFSQNSQFRNLIFRKIHNFEISFFTNLTFFKHQILGNFLMKVGFCPSVGRKTRKKGLAFRFLPFLCLLYFWYSRNEGCSIWSKLCGADMPWRHILFRALLNKRVQELQATRNVLRKEREKSLAETSRFQYTKVIPLTCKIHFILCWNSKFALIFPTSKNETVLGRFWAKMDCNTSVLSVPFPIMRFPIVQQQIFFFLCRKVEQP